MVLVNSSAFASNKNNNKTLFWTGLNSFSCLVEWFTRVTTTTQKRALNSIVVDRCVFVFKELENNDDNTVTDCRERLPATSWILTGVKVGQLLVWRINQTAVTLWEGHFYVWAHTAGAAALGDSVGKHLANICFALFIWVASSSSCYVHTRPCITSRFDRVTRVSERERERVRECELV